MLFVLIAAATRRCLSTQPGKMDLSAWVPARSGRFNEVQPCLDIRRYLVEARTATKPTGNVFQNVFLLGAMFES